MLRLNILVLSLLLLGGWSACNTTGSKDEVKVLPTDSLGPIGVVIDSITDLMYKRPTDHGLYLQRAEILLAVGQLNYALADAGRAYLMDSTDYKVHLTLADIYFRMRKPDRTKVYLLKARDLAPKEREPHYRLAEFNLFLQNYQDVINSANTALEIDEQDPRPYMLKGMAYKEIGDTAKAIDNLLSSVQHNPNNADAMVELGVLAFGKKDPQAENYFKNALKVNPKSKEAMYGLAMHYQTTDKLNEALATYLQILTVDSTYAQAYYNMGHIHYEQLRLYDEAIKLFTQAIEVNRNYPQALYMRGLCFEAKGDVSRAAAEYNHALTLDPKYELAAMGVKRVLKR